MVFGLTGGVATGKSLVSAELKRLGAHVIDADAIAREIVAPGSPAFEEIVAAFGPGILLADGAIDRKRLGDIVFNDCSKRQALNRITHPRIREKIRQEVEVIEGASKDPVIIIDAALLIEGGLYRSMAAVIVVNTSDDVQFKRLKSRNGLSDDEAKARISAQMPLREKARYADYLIDNNGAPDDTLRQVHGLYLRLAERARG